MKQQIKKLSGIHKIQLEAILGINPVCHHEKQAGLKILNGLFSGLLPVYKTQSYCHPDRKPESQPGIHPPGHKPVPR